MKKLSILLILFTLFSCSKPNNMSNLSFIFKNKPIEITNINHSVIMDKAFIYGKLVTDTSITYEISQIDINTVHIYSSKHRSNDMNNQDFLKGKIQIKGDNISMDVKSDLGSSLFISNM